MTWDMCAERYWDKTCLELHPRTLMAATGISMMKPETQFFYDIVKTAIEKR